VSGGHDYWARRWAEGRTGFHMAQVQPWLVDHAARLAPAGDECVLVPLCGKSVDMVWLERRGGSVVGVDLVEQGLRAFLAEQQRDFAEHEAPPFRVFASGRIELWCGDFFAVDPARHGTFPAIYDRAAIIALPEELRDRYARHLVTLMRPGARTLMIGYEYDQSRMAGPPFSVTRAEIQRRFGGACTIEPLGVHDLDVDRSGGTGDSSLRARGVDAAREYAVLLTRRR
jgi:thiopurine S-methyltransferase